MVTEFLDDLGCLVQKTTKQKPNSIQIDIMWTYDGTNVPPWFNKEIRNFCSANENKHCIVSKVFCNPIVSVTLIIS